ncbi:MAG: L-fucose mutarotase [Anaerolineaceae bacterium]|jgi:L-fucose mutarotase|nr:MAG: L-fucose mutarotase [Anaerolineaceae bacterium]
MLVGISPLLSPDLLSTLYRMGHGDEIVLADAHFPGESINSHVVRADGLKIVPLLDAILPLFALDKSCENPLIMMAPSPGDSIDLQVEKSYLQTIKKIWADTPEIFKIERYPFYDRAKKAFAVVMTGDTATYANIILRKGVTPL